MKRALFIASLLAGVAGIASAQTSIDLIDPGTVIPGQTFTVDIHADNSAAIAAFSFDVDFDPTYLTAVNAVGLGDFAGLSGFVDISDGLISYVYGLTSGDQIDMGSDIPLAELTFEALAPGVDTLSLANLTVISDPETFATEDNPTSNTLNVTVGTPEPASWTLAAGGSILLVAFAWRRRRRFSVSGLQGS